MKKHMPHLALSRFAAILLVFVGGLIMLMPFYFMFVFATHTRADIFTLPPPLWFGRDFFTNLALLNSKIPFWRSLGWSLYVAVMSTVLTLFFCSMAGYAFALSLIHI
jgi:multiple sugar transport system permease protein